MNHPFVNIMLPVFNGMPSLRSSIESIRRQTYTHWRCIICDDGSNDDTWSYLQTLKEDPRFLLLQNETNRGRGYTRQRILEQCTGKYICMLDAGDLMHPERIERQVEYLEAHPQVGLVSTAMLSFSTHNDRLIYRGSGSERDTILTFDGVHVCCFAPTMFQNPSSGVSFNGELRFCEDHHFLRQYLNHFPQYYCMSQPLYYYSEFDSFSKQKTQQAYLQDMMTYIHEHLFGQALLCLLKYLYSLLVFPWLSMDTILSRRGREATPQEREDFNQHVQPLL